MKVKRCNLLKYSKITVLHNIGEKGSVKCEPVKTDPIILPHHYSIIIIFIYNIIIIEEKRGRGCVYFGSQYTEPFLVREDVVCFCPAIDFVNTDFKS